MLRQMCVPVFVSEFKWMFMCKDGNFWILCTDTADALSVWRPDGHLLRGKNPLEHHRNQSSSITINITKVSTDSFQSYLKHRKKNNSLWRQWLTLIESQKQKLCKRLLMVSSMIAVTEWKKLELNFIIHSFIQYWGCTFCCGNRRKKVDL